MFHSFPGIDLSLTSLGSFLTVMRENNMKNLEILGFDEYFSANLETEKLEYSRPARVVTMSRDQYVVSCGNSDIPAEVTGKLRFSATGPEDLPTVGDWVYAQIFDKGDFAVIHDILPRKNCLRRKMAGKKVDHQIIGANIDTAFLVQSLDHDYNLRRLERYLVAIMDARIEPVILLSKEDLLGDQELAEKQEEIRSTIPGIDMVSFSTLDNVSVEKIRKKMTPGKTYCLLGSSGVGKTTLLNRLTGEDSFRTHEVRKSDSRGRHTTTRRQLIILPDGAILVDNPGMREFANIGVSDGIDKTFEDISQIASLCRFRDCTHTTEKGCAILSALESGEISRERYDNFMKIKRESAFHQMSYLEKRRRDRQFGKMCRDVMKQKQTKK